MKCHKTKKISIETVKLESRQIHSMYESTSGNSTSLDGCFENTMENYIKNGWEIIEGGTQ